MRLVLTALAIAISACSPAPAPPSTAGAPPPSSPADDGPEFPTDLPRLEGGVAATVMNVLDGDSMEVVIDGTPDEIRLLGINAPESDECLGDIARDAMVDLVEGREALLYGTERDRFGRLLVFVEVGGAPVGWLQVRRGLALALSVDHPRLAAYGAAEDDAFVDELGIWARDACGPPTDAIIGIDHIEWDPPGRDSSNRNGEFVRLSNGGEPVDMTGWVLRDESTRWRYHFPDGYLLGSQVIIRTGCGEDDVDELHWCADDPLWSNGGDTAILLDPSGNVVARVSYGAKTER